MRLFFLFSVKFHFIKHSCTTLLCNYVVKHIFIFCFLRPLIQAIAIKFAAIFVSIRQFYANFNNKAYSQHQIIGNPPKV